MPSATTPARSLIDTHLHVFDPVHFAYAEDRRYTPPAASFEALGRHLAALGCRHFVAVQPSTYGTDNACLLHTLARAGGRGRGIAVVGLASTTPAQLQTLHAAGVRGIRLNFAVRHEGDAERATAELQRAAALVNLPGWCMQVHAGPELLGALAAALPAFQVPLVLDHLAGLRADSPAVEQQALLRLLATGRVYVKLSAFYRASSDPLGADLQPLLTALIAARPDRLLWGSDWPHTGGGPDRDPTRTEAFRQVDLAAALALIERCAPGPAALQALFHDNAARLYGFAELETP